tara:strand:+ start:1206 stop:2366 length:1161 start_codon:yes stop_codon:yes gene_type:complete
MSIGDALTGIATGYISEALRDSRQADQERYDRIKLAENQYYNVDLPNYKREEKLRDTNIAYINAELGPVYANYFDAQDITLDTTNTRSVVKQFKDAGFSEAEKLEIESTITGRRKERQEDLDEKLTMIRDRESRKSGGIGDNIAKMFFSKDEEDISKVGVKQGTDMEAPPQDTFTPMSELLGTGKTGTYNIKDYGTERREFDTDFRSTFSNRLTGAPEIDVPKTDPRYDLQQSLLIGYDDAVKNGYKDGKFSYMLNKYIDNQFKKQGITGYPTGFPETAEKQTVDTDLSTDTAAIPGDGKKFDTPDVSKIGVKEDVKINLQSKRPVEGGGSGSPATVINDLRDIISRISNSASLSDDEKSTRIDTARERAKERIKAMGLDPDNFNL